MRAKIDKGDLRLKKRKDPQYKTDYARISERVKAGLCYTCGNVPVKDRKICVGCSQRAAYHNAISGFRKVLRMHGIENPSTLLDTLTMMKHTGNADMIGALIEAVEECEYRHAVKVVEEVPLT